MAYDTIITVSQKVGNTADYSNVQDAVAYTNTQPELTHTIRVLGGVYTGVLLFTKPVKIVFEDQAVMDGGGAGTCINYALPNVAYHNLLIYGLKCRNYINAFYAVGNTALWCLLDSCEILDCTYMILGRCRNLALNRCIIDGVTFQTGSGGKYINFAYMQNCVITNSTNVMLTNTVNNIGLCTNNLIKGSSITVRIVTSSLMAGYNESTRDDVHNNVLDNCTVRFSTETGAIQSSTKTYVAVNSMAEFTAKCIADTGTDYTGANDFDFDSIAFNDIVIDNYSLPNKDLYQYSTKDTNPHIGAIGYSVYVDSTSMNAPPTGTLVNGYAETTAAPLTGVEFICNAVELNAVQYIGKIHAIVDVGAGGEIMSSLTEDTNSRILDVEYCYSLDKSAAELDAAPEAYNSLKIGLLDAALTIDSISQLAKSIKLKFTIKNEGASIDFGEVKVYQLIVETFEVLGTEVYNVKQLSDGNGNFILKETSAGVWESAYKIEVNPKNNQEVQAIWDTATGLTQVSELTAQQFMDAISASTDLTALFLEDRGAIVDAEFYETNMTIVTVNTATPIPTYTFRTF